MSGKLTLSTLVGFSILTHLWLEAGRGRGRRGKRGKEKKREGGGERENARAFTTTVLIKISAHGCIQ